MLSLSRTRYRARFAETEDDIAAAQRLRHLAFRAARGRPRADGRDADGFDARCRHVLVEEARGGTLVCCFRLLPLAGGAEIGRSYSAQYYELSALRRFAGPMLEMGRFCIHPEYRDPAILRTAWSAMRDHVEREGVELIFGCSSFLGTEADGYIDAFALLHQRHLAPRRWWPRVKAPEVFRFARRLAGRQQHRAPDPSRAMRAMPPLLRSYLAMGGWVSDHAVIDRDLGTMHVFTGVEVRKVPAARLRHLGGAAV